MSRCALFLILKRRPSIHPLFHFLSRSFFFVIFFLFLFHYFLSFALSLSVLSLPRAKKFWKFIFLVKNEHRCLLKQHLLLPATCFQLLFESVNLSSFAGQRREVERIAVFTSFVSDSFWVLCRLWLWERGKLTERKWKIETTERERESKMKRFGFRNWKKLNAMKVMNEVK